MNGQRRATHRGFPVLVVLAVLAVTTLPACHEHPGGSTSVLRGTPDAGPIATNPAPPLGSPLPRIPPPLDVASPPADATPSASGLVTRTLEAGTGLVHPAGFDLVRVRYVAWTRSGAVFTASPPGNDVPGAAPGGGASLPMRVSAGDVPGLSEGLELMVAGERRRLWIPAAIASRAEPRPDLVMDVELVAIVPTPRPPPLPEDATAPPASARHTYSGLTWRLVSATAEPGPKAGVTQIAVFNRTIWDREGDLVTSTFPEARPVSGLVSELAPPWSEALQLMSVGDTVRLWYPDDGLRRGGRGPYVADIELLYVYSRPR